VSKKIKSWLVPLLKIAFAGAIIYWLLTSGKLDFSQLKFLYRPEIFAGALAILIVNTAIASERWRHILKAQGFRMGFWETLRLSYIGAFFNFVIPGGVGGDVVKSFYVAKDNPTARLKSVVTIAMDRLLGLFSMLVMAIAVMVWDFKQVSQQEQLLLLLKFLVLIFVVFCLFWAVVFSRRVYRHGRIISFLSKLPAGKKLGSIYTSFSEYGAIKKAFFKSIFISFLAQFVLVGFFIYVGEIVGMGDVPWSVYFFVVPVGFMVNAIPITPAGVGVGQAAFYFLFNVAINQQTHLGSTAITAFQIVSFCIGLIGAVFYYFK
jgi:glycosyltransferase 2 family protein